MGRGFIRHQDAGLLAGEQLVQPHVRLLQALFHHMIDVVVVSRGPTRE